MTKDFLRMRSQLALVERRPSKRLFFDGPVVTQNGLCFSRGFEAELLKIDREATRVLWRVSTKDGPYDFVAYYCLRGHLVAGMGVGVAVFEAEDGKLLWSRLDLGGLVTRDGKLLSTTDTDLVELDAATGREMMRLPIGSMRLMNAQGSEGVLCPEFAAPLYTLDDETQLRELRRPFRAINLDTGDVLWERDIASEIWQASVGQTPHYVTNLVPGSLGESWIGRWRDSTFACNRKDGSLLWFAPYRCGLRADVKDGRVFGMDEGGLFHVLDERTGELLARYDGAGLAGAMFPRPAAMLGPYAVYGMESGHVAVFDPRDGRLVWSKRHKSGTPNVGVVEGRVYVTTEKGELLVYEPTVPVN